MRVMGERVRAWWMGLAKRFRRARLRAGFMGPIGAPRVRDKNPITGEVKVRFRHDVRIDPGIYKMYKQLCEERDVTTSEQTRRLIIDWIKEKCVLDPWEEFVKEKKSEGFSTPQEWLKAKLGLKDI